MKIKIALALLAATLCFTTAQAKEWYEGGTLQDASISKFVFAKHDNQLATAADFILGAMTEQAKQKITLDELKMAAEAVVQCMQNAPDMWPDLPSNKAQAFAGMCQVSLKKQYPWLVSIMDEK